MEHNDTSTDWRADVRSRFVIEPTVNAMQRYLLFTMRSASVHASESTPGRFQTLVEWDEAMWQGTGDSAAEAMGRVLLAMTGSPQATDVGPNTGETDDRKA